MSAEPTPYGTTPTPRPLAELRLEAERLARAEDDAGLLALADRLRRDDPRQWPHLWAPLAALAARRTGDDRAWPLLEEAVDLGFTQPDLLAPDLPEAFADDDRWAPLVARMRPAPPEVELLDWPDPPPQQPVVLDRIAAEREPALRARVPGDLVEPGHPWATAVALLRWVARSWDHANDHVDSPDALEVLDRVAEGERFACVEYSIVLSQVLNAVGVPARRVQLLQAPHHVGLGRGHVVSEAWLDDLGAWVLLDGQNGAFWVDEDGAPLGVPQLVARHREGRPATMSCQVRPLDDAAQAFWATYVATVLTTGTGVVDGDGAGFALSFQGVSVPRADVLRRGTRHTHPRLDDVTVGVTGTVDRPRLRFGTPHPHATGFRVRGADGAWVEDADPDGTWPLRRGDGAPSEHVAEVAVVTPVGTGRGHRLRWRG
ncbi:hypothetical protein GCM10023340_38300 [Nocardioides marinquilinus]|uniref:Transglutaminase-like domain-containing protein n=1 Tax=Nocardioides marinquilinus TaxID=1210400 RepID=A0ABP9Q5Y7_9ACTN